MFETLSERLTSALGTLTGKGRLSEKDIEAALRQVRMALWKPMSISKSLVPLSRKSARKRGERK